MYIIQDSYNNIYWKLMSRKNNKSIKRRYIEHIKEMEKKVEQKREEKAKNREEN